MSDSLWKVMAETFIVGGLQISVSASLISFNKYLMSGPFPYAKVFTTVHMTVTTLLSMLLYKFAPSLYPTMGKARANWKTVLKFMAPLGLLFAVSMYCGNKAYSFCSVAFLQFCKEGNVALMFALSCLLGLQTFTWPKVGVLGVVVLGCAICAHGELNFVWVGFLLQMISQTAECSKNLIGEIVMSGSGMKLDVLSFVFLQAPISLVPLVIFMVLSWEPEIWGAVKANWHLLLANALNAFANNLVVATSVKRLSAVAFSVIGVIKDGVIVVVSSMIFHDPISVQQQIGFVIIIIGVLMWAHLKIVERRTAQQQQQQQEESNASTASLKETELADYGEPSPTSRALRASNDSI